METAEILQAFNGLVDNYAKHRRYIEKAREKAGKFRPEVVEKVILDHEIQASEVADEILPLVPKLEEALASLEEESAGLRSAREDADRRLEELQLRLEIEELTQEEFDSRSQDVRAELAQAEERLSEYDAQREEVQQALDRWTELAEAAGQKTGRSVPEEPPSQEAFAAEPGGEPESMPEPEVVLDEAEGGHVHQGGMVDDVSAVFGGQPREEQPATATATDYDEPMIALEGGEELGPEPSEEIDFGLVAEESMGPAEVELNLVESEGEGVVGEEIDISPPEQPQPDKRRALLLYQEGTPEEQIYPFTGDTITIGRGRDNDIQIKNDSKVSRYHCKIYRKGPHFYIEDNQSSNGTLVDGELIKERRLFGGEEIIIGETFFRFRITD